jgi:hypothetical protein
MNVLKRFEDEFNELVNTAYDTYWEQDPFPKEKFSVVLKTTLTEALIGKERTFNLTKEDLEQQLSLLWLHYLEQYNSKKNKPGTSVRSYLIRRSIWGLRDWLRYELNITTEEYTPFHEEEVDSEFKIDLMFLLKGTDYHCLKGLSPYERYIIFLKFKEDKSILQMSYILQKDRRVIREHFNSIILKIKENNFNGLQDKQNSRRHCY